MDKLSDELMSAAGFNRRRGGFTKLLRNLTRKDFLIEFRKFAKDVSPNDDVLFYYSGHGLMCGGNIFLVPTDARHTADNPLSPDNVDDECINLSTLRLMIGNASPRLKIFCIDACATSLDGSTTTATASSMQDRGIKRRKPQITTVEMLHQSTQGLNWFIINAAASETTALETSDGGGMFTTGFLRAIQQPMTTISDLGPTIVDHVTKEKREPGKSWIQIPTVSLNTLEQHLSKGWRFNTEDKYPPGTYEVVLPVNLDRELNTHSDTIREVSVGETVQLEKVVTPRASGMLTGNTMVRAKLSSPNGWVNVHSSSGEPTLLRRIEQGTLV